MFASEPFSRQANVTNRRSIRWSATCANLPSGRPCSWCWQLPALQVLREQSVVLRTVPRLVVRQPARSVPSWAVLWERLPAQSEGFLEFHLLLLLRMRGRPPVPAAQPRNRELPRRRGRGGLNPCVT